MAKQTINIGTSANARDGDPLRTAFDKINDNFDELYAGNFADPEAVGSALKPDTDATYDLGASDKQWADLYVSDFIYLGGNRIEVDPNGNLVINSVLPSVVQDLKGSVFADDSTILVDAVAGSIVGPVTPSTFKPPMLTQAQIDALTPEIGMMVYNTTTGKFQGYAEDANNDSTTAWADLH
jgi:hypothetical protein